MDIELKPFTREDVDFAVAQAVREKWATGPPLFDLHVEYEPAGAFIAWAGNERVGMVTATRYAVTGWIGNLIVEPEYRNRGIGRKLMEHALSYLRDAGIRTVRLDADPPGIPLYESMGFVEECESRRFQWARSTVPACRRVREFSRRDLPEAAEFDGKCFGDDRGRLLDVMLRHAWDAIVLRDAERMTGFLIMTQTTEGIRFGPCCAIDRAAAERLFTAALERNNGGPANVGVLSLNQNGCDLLATLGFEPSPSSWRMIWGERKAVGALDRYYAIAGGAIG
jgi:GNAT superfamily N-acetyltransferase